MKRQWGQVLVVTGLMGAMFVAVGCSQQTQQVRRVSKPAPALQTIHFDYDRSGIKPEYKAVLQGNASWMKEHSRTNVVVEGNCDQRGSSEYNIALGWRRARSTKNYMVSLGVSPSRLQTKSFGKERPVCHQMTESCWWKNRRADFRQQ